MKLKVE
jgi:hypothetical protein